MGARTAIVPPCPATRDLLSREYQWAWAIPLDDEVVSVGIVVPAQYFLDRNESKRDFLTRELRELNDELTRRLLVVELVDDVHVIRNHSFQVAGFAGDGFICVGDSHRFIDPISPPGSSSRRRRPATRPTRRARYFGNGRSPALLREHTTRSEQAIDVLEDVIDAFWENPLAFSVLVHVRCRDELVDVFAGRIYPGARPAVGGGHSPPELARARAGVRHETL